MAMEDTNISKLYKDFESIPSLCLYDVTVFYQGERKELSQTSFTTRLLVVGQAVRVEQCTPSVSADSSHRHEAGNIFPIPSTPTSFAIYIGFQNPEQEGTLLEAKFQQSPFAEGGYTWDIAGNKSQNEFGVSLEVHFLSASPQRRVDISYKTKTGTTSLRIFPSSGDNGESPDAEEHFLQKLIDSPLSRARADTLLLNGLYLCAQFEQTNRIQYLDLSIQALSAGQPYTQGYFHECDSVPYVFFCHLLFIRCTLPHGAAFVDKAFDALASLESIPTDSGNGFLEPFVKTVLMVTGNHNCPEHYYTIALNVSTIHYMLTTSCMKRGHNNHGFMDKSTVARLPRFNA